MRSSVIVAVSLVAFTVAAPIFQRDTTQATDVTTTTGSTSDDDALTRLMVAAQNYDPNDDASVAELQSAGNDLSPEQTAQLQTVAENVANALAILKGLSAQDRRDVEKYIIKHLTPTQVATLLMLLDKQSPQQAANAADPQNGAEPGKLPDGTVKRYFSIPEEQRPEVLSYVLAADLSQEQFEKIQKYANKVKAEEDDDDDDKKPQTKPAKKPETKPAPKPAPAPEAKTDTTGQSQTGHATTFPKEQPVPAPAAAAASNGSSDDTAAALTQDQADQIGAYLQCIDANTANQLIEEAKTAGASDDDLATLKGEIPSLNDPKWVAPQECAAAAAAAGTAGARRSLADLD